ncbi:hypothetical protein LRHMDP2_1219 [Lacticaseibacillus rhamnosus LRHMDP2]|uniref:Mobile element protein n=1 Tax=Lacticaseibacillus rhamnosus LRHMDP3 TaxID=1203259 RepID=A0AB33XVG4_LACRH|nr:hypothetical protein LRHMDP3_1161 [Lacticaseibacillus rhamnosus LRHMDP3]EKS52052.1 hypothetical protein LRHMDP2_1219 [Lacticaseibacillus rhamnosus LRHMDP2]
MHKSKMSHLAAIFFGKLVKRIGQSQSIYCLRKNGRTNSKKQILLTIACK